MTIIIWNAVLFGVLPMPISEAFPTARYSVQTLQNTRAQHCEYELCSTSLLPDNAGSSAPTRRFGGWQMMWPGCGRASCASHLALSPKACIALISDSSELARVYSVHGFSFVARESLVVPHAILNDGVDVAGTRKLLTRNARSFLRSGALLCSCLRNASACLIAVRTSILLPSSHNARDESRHMLCISV